VCINHKVGINYIQDSKFLNKKKIKCLCVIKEHKHYISLSASYLKERLLEAFVHLLNTFLTNTQA
jgi:hypothetical protein